jgi:hypothetical protein
MLLKHTGTFQRILDKIFLMIFVKVHVYFQIRSRIHYLEFQIRKMFEILADPAPDPQHWYILYIAKI